MALLTWKILFKAKVGNNNDQLRIATPPRVAHAKPPGPIPYNVLE